MSIRKFYRRRFLNLRGHHQGAHVIANVRVAKCLNDENRRYVDAMLTIADCSRTVQLDFDSFERDDLANSLHKARLLRDTVVDFTAALERAAAEVFGDSAVGRQARASTSVAHLRRVEGGD